MEVKASPYIVYVKVNAEGYITDINSSAFLDDTSGWVEIDRGFGDRYALAQGNYFQKSILTDSDVYRYKLEDGEAVKCTPEEIRGQRVDPPADKMPGLESRVTELENSNMQLRRTVEEVLSKITKL